MISRSLLFVDRFVVVNLSSTSLLCRHNGHHRRTSSRFKWPQKGFMPSRTPYQMFPAISTSDEAKGFVSYLTKNERLLLLSQLQKFPEEKDFDGLLVGIVVETARLKILCCGRCWGHSSSVDTLFTPVTERLQNRYTAQLLPHVCACVTSLQQV